jgi:hypothetical protein
VEIPPKTVAKAIMNGPVETTVAQIGCTDLGVEHIAPKGEYLTLFQDRKAVRQKTLANWLRLKAMSHRFPLRLN